MEEKRKQLRRLIKEFSLDERIEDVETASNNKYHYISENSIQTLLDRAREEGREELLNSIVVGIEQLRSIVMMFNPMSAEIRAKQSGEVEAYNGLLEKLSKLKTKEK